MTKRQELQAEAMDLGINPEGLSVYKLEKAIEEAKEKTGVEDGRKTETKTKANVAIIRNAGNQEIRKYTEETHGPEFAQMAEEFASRRDVSVELRYIDKRNICPKCGHVLR